MAGCAREESQQLSCSGGSPPGEATAECRLCLVSPYSAAQRVLSTGSMAAATCLVNYSEELLLSC